MLRDLLKHIRGFFLPKSRNAIVSERRHLIRVRCHLPAQIKFKGQTFGGWMMDLGVQGLRLRLQSQLPVGSEFKMRATLPGQSNLPWLNFRVLWTRSHRDKKGIFHGVGYVDSMASLRKSWVAFLFRELGINERHAGTRRKYLRVEGRIPLEVLPEPGHPESPPSVEMINIGVGGLLVRSRDPLRTKQAYFVRIGPYEGLPPAGPFRTEVINHQADPSGTYVQAALRFTEMDEHLVQNVGRYVVKLLHE